MTVGNNAENYKEKYKTKKRNVSEICKFQTIRKTTAFNPPSLWYLQDSWKVRLFATRGTPK